VKLYFFSGGAACQETMTAEEFGMKLYSFPTSYLNNSCVRRPCENSYL